jgi:hypothetical protein
MGVERVIGVSASENPRGQTPNTKKIRQEKTPKEVWLMAWFSIFGKLVRFIWPLAFCGLEF